MAIIFTLFGFILGTILGSLLKVLADRSLSGKSFFGRSYCNYCKKTLGWYDLIPIISFIFLKGRCRSCHKKLSLEYPLIELTSGFLVGLLFYQSFPAFPQLLFTLTPYPPPLTLLHFSLITLNLLLKTFFIIILLTLFLTDLKKMFIPDRIILPAIIISIISLFILIILKITYLYFSLSDNPVGKYLLPPHSWYFQDQIYNYFESFVLSILSGFILAGFFLMLIIITRGKGMGGGDVKLGLFMGINLGVENTILAAMLSFLIGAIISIILIIFRKKRFGSVVPFGPFLVIGSLIALYWGDKIIKVYLGMLGL